MSKGRYVDIFVEPDANAPCGYAFRMEEGGLSTNRLVFDKHQDDMSKDEHHKIEFKLHNTKGAQLCFAKNKDKVLWATEVFDPTGDECPCPGDSFDGLYVDPTVYPQDRVLTVINTNMKKQFFAYCGDLPIPVRQTHPWPAKTHHRTGAWHPVSCAVRPFFLTVHYLAGVSGR